MKKKYIAILGYVIILWAASWLIFGESGVIETNFKQKEILRLKAEIFRSTVEIEAMGQQYGRLSKLSIPDQNFLASVDRKKQDIVVYKFSEPKKASVSKSEEQQIIYRSLIIGGAFILTGIISIVALTFGIRPYGGGKK